MANVEEVFGKKERKHIRQRKDADSVEREPVILVGGYRPQDLLVGEKPLEELEGLAKAAGARVVGRVVQNIKSIRPDTYIGPGKAQEVKDLAEETNARCILFDHDLTPAQGRSLDELIEVKVMDRTDLILDIFASRARTKMAKVQVMLAMNEYRLPRLRRMWTHLERQSGGIGVRGGPGERQIETDRRKLEKNIRELKDQLKEMSARKKRLVKSRGQHHFLVSLVGYTNAGKSTLMHALTGEKVLVEDKLFATLDTKTSQLSLGGGIDALLSDTVGFIRRLPHDLVASFHATLEEARSSDLLLHVVDVSSNQAREQMRAVDTVLKEIGVDGRELRLVFNKVDAFTPETEIEYHRLCRSFPDAISVSALSGLGLDALRELVRSSASNQAAPVQLKVFGGDGKTFAYLATHFFEEQREVVDDWIHLTGRASPSVIAKLRTLGDSVEVVEAP